MALAMFGEEGGEDISCEEEVDGEWGQMRRNLSENDFSQTGAGGASHWEAGE